MLGFYDMIKLLLEYDANSDSDDDYENVATKLYDYIPSQGNIKATTKI